MDGAVQEDGAGHTAREKKRHAQTDERQKKYVEVVLVSDATSCVVAPTTRSVGYLNPVQSFIKNASSGRSSMSNARRSKTLPWVLSAYTRGVQARAAAGPAAAARRRKRMPW